MGYTFIFISLFAGALKGFCGKKTSGYTNGISDAIFANIIRMALCIIIGFILIAITGDFNIILPNTQTLFISALSGISTAVFVVTWLVSVNKNTYMLVEIFLMLGTIITLILSKIFFSESIKSTQWIGVFILFTAILIMYSYNNSIKTKITPLSLIILFLCGFSSGIADFSQKVFSKKIVTGSASVFNFYTYIFSTLFLITFFIICNKNKTQSVPTNFKKFFGYIFIMAICLFANSYFKTLAARYLSAILLYPLNQGCALILSSLMAVVFFKEKLNIKAIIGILAAFIGLIIINLI